MTSDAEHAVQRPPRSPKDRRTALTREQILTAAVAIIDAEGVEALTMRRLGQALGRDPMAIYRHAADKDALLDGAVEHVAAELVTPREPDRRNGGRELGSGPAPHRAHVPPGRPGPPPRGAAAADPATVRPARPATAGHAPTPRGADSSCSAPPGSTNTARCTPPVCSPGSSTATSCTNSRNRSTTPTRPTTCSASDCTGCPSPSSPGSAPSPPPWPPTTAPPNSTKDWPSSSPAYAANCAPDRPTC